MNFLKKISNFIKAVGRENFTILLKESNIEKVKEFCKTLISPSDLPTEIKVGDRTYELLGFLKGDEEIISGNGMVRQAKEMLAHLGEDDGQYLLDHQQNIPENFRGKVYFVFTNWHRPDGSGDVCYVYWDDDRWIGGWVSHNDYYQRDAGLILRRK